MHILKTAACVCWLAACTYDAGRLLPPDPDSTTSVPQADAGKVVSAPSDAGAKPLGGADTGTPGIAADEGTPEPVAFLQGRAQGAMSGLGYVSLGVFGKLTSPTCAGMPIASLPPLEPPVTFDSTCWASSIKWNAPNALCVSGTIPAWSPSPNYMDYQTNWGILVGAATRDPVRGIGIDYSRIALSWSGDEVSGKVWAVVHLEGDEGNKTYCAQVTSGISVRLTSFNTECFFGSGDNLAATDVRKIDKVGIQIPSRRSALQLENFCLNKIMFIR